ncbi:MAG: NUDIX domain-containing protein [Flavobacteriales bacterium]
MRRNYDVYIGGKPLRFVEEDVTERSDGHPVLEIASADALDAALSQLEGKACKGLQLRSSKGFDAWQAFQDRHRFVLAAGGLVVDEEGRLLTIKRLGVWDLPKGKVEKKEVVEDAAVREVQEECGLKKVQLVRPVTSTWHTYERKGRQELKRTDWFLMQASASEDLVPQSDEGIEEVRWIDRAELTAVLENTYSSLIPVFTAWEAMAMDA